MRSCLAWERAAIHASSCTNPNKIIVIYTMVLQNGRQPGRGAAMGDPMQAWPMPVLLHMSSKQYMAARLGGPPAMGSNKPPSSRQHTASSCPKRAPVLTWRAASRTTR